MYTFLLFFIFTGCFLWYTSSAKVKLQHGPGLLLTLSNDKKRAKITAIILLTISYLCTMYLQGIITGTLAFGAYLMGFFSLTVLLWPYRYLQWSQLLFVMILALIFEIIIF